MAKETTSPPKSPIIIQVWTAAGLLPAVINMRQTQAAGRATSSNINRVLLTVPRIVIEFDSVTVPKREKGFARRAGLDDFIVVSLLVINTLHFTRFFGNMNEKWTEMDLMDL